MKTIATTLTLLACAACAAAQEAPDTIASIADARELTVTRTPNGLKIVVDGRAENPDFYYEYMSEYATDSTTSAGPALHIPILGNYIKSGNSSSTGRFPRAGVRLKPALYAGTSIPVGNTPMLASFEIGLSRVADWQLRFCNSMSLSIGAGLGYVQYAVGDGMRLDAAHQRLLLVPREEGTAKHSSRLKVFRLHFPAMLTVHLGRKASVSAGALINLNSYVPASTSYTIGNTRTQQTFKDLHQRILTADITAEAYTPCGLGIYVRYSQQGLFRTGWGPDFKTVSVGLTLKID